MRGQRKNPSAARGYVARRGRIGQPRLGRHSLLATLCSPRPRPSGPLTGLPGRAVPRRRAALAWWIRRCAGFRFNGTTQPERTHGCRGLGAGPGRTRWVHRGRRCCALGTGSSVPAGTREVGLTGKLVGHAAPAARSVRAVCGSGGCVYAASLWAGLDPLAGVVGPVCRSPVCRRPRVPTAPCPSPVDASSEEGAHSGPMGWGVVFRDGRGRRRCFVVSLKSAVAFRPDCRTYWQERGCHHRPLVRASSLPRPLRETRRHPCMPDPTGDDIWSSLG